jgi:hypothetical protein
MTRPVPITASAITAVLFLGCAPSARPEVVPPAPSVSRSQGSEQRISRVNRQRPVDDLGSTRPDDRAPRPEDTIHVFADQVITERADAAVRTVSNINGAHDVVITTNRGVVTLEGDVPSDYDRVEIEQIVRTIPGVSRVQNQLRLAP